MKLSLHSKVNTSILDKYWGKIHNPSATWILLKREISFLLSTPIRYHTFHYQESHLEPDGHPWKYTGFHDGSQIFTHGKMGWELTRSNIHLKTGLEIWSSGTTWLRQGLLF